MVAIVAGCVIGLLVIAIIIIIAVGFKYKYSKDKQCEINKTQRHKDKTEEERKKVREDKMAVLTDLKDIDEKTYLKAAAKFIADDGPPKADNADSGKPDNSVL